VREEIILDGGPMVTVIKVYTISGELGFVAWLLHEAVPTAPPFTVVSNFEAMVDDMTGGKRCETGSKEETSFRRGRKNSWENSYLSMDVKVHEQTRLRQGILSNSLLEDGATVRRVLVYSAGARMTMHHVHDCGRPTAPPPPSPQPMPTMPPPPP
jgi:hypothetical protein